MKLNLWFALRVAYVAYWAIAGLRAGLLLYRVGPGSCLFALAWGCVITRFLVMRQYKKADREEPWLRPSWFLPFRQSQPFQFWYLGGVGFVAFAVCAVLRDSAVRAFALNAGLPFEAFAGFWGLGFLIGIYWAVAAHREKFE